MNETSDADHSTSKRRKTCLDDGIVTPPPMPPTSDTTHTTSEENRYHPSEQSQQSSSSCDLSLQHLIHTDPPHPFGYRASSGRCDGTNTNTNSRSEVTMDGTTHQSFNPVAFSQSNLMQEAHGSILSQGLQYDCEYRAPSKDRPIPNPDTLEGDGYNSVATVQLFQNTPTTDQAATNTAETFKSHSHAAMADASMVLNPPSYIHQGNPSFGTLRQEQIGNTGFDPSSYISQGQVENRGFDPSSYISQGQVENTGFDPSSYISQENLSLGTPHEEQIGNMSFDPSNYT